MPAHPHALLGAALLLVACGEKRPPAPVVTLAPPADTVQTELAEVTAAVWLGGERWALLAPTDAQVILADVGARSLRPLPADGGKRLRNPSTLFRAKDTLYVGDWGLRQTSHWTLEGK